MAFHDKGIGYYIPPNLRDFGKGAYDLFKEIRPFNPENLPTYDFNKTFKRNLLDMAVDAGILGLDFATLGTASVPRGIALKVADEVAETAAKKSTSKLNNIEKGKLLDDELEKIANNPELLAEVEKLNNIEFSKFLKSRIGFAPQTENLSKKRRAFDISNPVDSTKNIIKEKGEDFFKDKTPSEIQQYLKQEKGIEMGNQNIMLYFPFKRVKRTNVQNTVNDVLLKLDSYDNLRLEDIKNLPGIKELGLSDDGLRSAIKRARKNVEGIPNFKLLKSKGDEAMSFQTKYNPALDKRLDYVKDLNELYYLKKLSLNLFGLKMD